MQPDEFIPADQFCAVYHIELSFIQTLHESGLIEVREQQGAAFLAVESLPDLEKFVRWHYELSINPEGIEVISSLLRQMDNLREENRTLVNRLRRYESGATVVITEVEEVQSVDAG